MLTFRYAHKGDARLYFQWVNDPHVRRNSFTSDEILWEDHLKWFNTKMEDNSCFMYVFLLNDTPVGQVRIEWREREHVVGVSVDSAFRGKGIASPMVEMACKDYFDKTDASDIVAYIKKDNEPSIRLFRKAGFLDESEIAYNGQASLRLSVNKLNIGRKEK